jgi:hypothetical protein
LAWRLRKFDNDRNFAEDFRMKQGEHDSGPSHFHLVPLSHRSRGYRFDIDV